MDLICTSPVKGKMPGDKITVSDKEGAWLVAEGYARKASGKNPGSVTITPPKADSDPRLADNREKPGASKPGGISAPPKAEKASSSS